MQKNTIKAIVVEDQPVIWDYAKSCLEGLCEIKAFCANTKEAEKAFREHKPDFVWLDCYLGEVSEANQGLKNSGMQIAKWIKSHNPKVKIFIFTSSNEVNILEMARAIDVEGIAIGGKFIQDKSIVIDGIKKVLDGQEWLSPNIIEDINLKELGRMTILEYCIACSLILGKQTAEIADELDCTRKRVNNATYRIKDKLGIASDVERDEFLDLLQDRLKDSFNANDYYKLPDVITMSTLSQEILAPALKRVKAENLYRTNLDMLSE